MALRNSDNSILFHKRYLKICVYSINPIVALKMSQVQLLLNESKNHFTWKNIHVYVRSYIKFDVESAKCHIGDMEKSPKLKHGPFR